MNNTVKTDRLDEAIWNCYRTTIESLYWGNSLDRIDTHMKKHHGFVASKSQYERHFRKWELRKNLTTAEWAATIRYLMKNSIDLEQVEVLFKGREIPQNRVLQEIARRSSRTQTLYDDSHRLPKDITVRPRSHAPTIDAANGLQIVPAPVARSPSPSMQFELDFGLATITSPSVYGRILNGPTLVAEYSLPFSWTHFVDFDFISQSLISSQQLVKWTKPSKMRLDAIFHSKHQPLVDTTCGSHSTTLPLYAITLLANNVSLGGRTTSNDSYALLKALPLRDVSQSLKALPAPILDALKERVFATAVRFGDADLVSTMLELDMDPREQIMMEWPSESIPTYPLQFAVAAGSFEVAKTLSLHMCREASHVQIDELFDHVLEGDKPNHNFTKSGRLSESEKTELACIVLRAGARPHRKYLKTGNYNVSVASLKQLMEASMAGILAWLEAGLLEHYFTLDIFGQQLEVRISLARDVLQFVLYSDQHYLPKSDPRLKTAIMGALHAALLPHHERAVEMLLGAISLLGYHLDDRDACIGDTGMPGIMNRSTLEAFDNADWNLAASLMIEKASIASSDKAHPSKEQKSELQDAIEQGDLRLAYHRYKMLSDEQLRYAFASDIVELAISLGNSSFAITIVECMKDRLELGLIGLLVLLKHGQITTVSTLLTQYPSWKSSLDAASGLYDVSILEALFFNGLAAPFIGAGEGEHAISCTDKVQLGCRTVAYHAMATNDFKLCKWLLQLGMDPDEFYVEPEYDYSIKKTPRLHCSFPGGTNTLGVYDGHMIPSLLAVAAEKSNVGWMKFLVTEGVYVVDSMALLRAIKLRATIATIHFLLDAAKPRISSAERNYGVAALRQAISYRDITRIDVLCGVVNINGIEPFEEEFEHQRPAISPLGQAIIADDSEMVRLLLAHGANPNACISYDGLKMLKHIKSHIRRVTPLLAAIDVQSLTLVKILVEHGAELQYTRIMGITRTPLQRAAETGSFDIVEYLVNQDATIDAIPVYSGGTALQLAAMNGFCGIAAFLLESGADPNYPPAKGQGRTAFEAAAEWGHVDTMSLLMQWKVNLDAQFGEPPESQYERALGFAEDNGFMASSRFVEHLYGQRARDESWPAGLALDSI